MRVWRGYFKLVKFSLKPNFWTKAPVLPWCVVWTICIVSKWGCEREKLPSSSFVSLHSMTISAKNRFRKKSWKLLQCGSRILMIKNAFLTNVVQVVVQAWKFAREVIHMRICTSARASENLFCCCCSSSLSLILNFILLSNFVTFFVNYVIFREWVWIFQSC